MIECIESSSGTLSVEKGKLHEKLKEEGGKMSI